MELTRQDKVTCYAHHTFSVSRTPSNHTLDVLWSDHDLSVVQISNQITQEWTYSRTRLIERARYKNTNNTIQLHNENGPAHICWDPQGVLTHERYRINGEAP